MTVGQELEKRTDLVLFHNHMTIEPVIDIFGYFKGDTILKLREVIFNDFVESSNEGMIHTLNDCKFVKDVTDFYKEANSCLLHKG